MNNIPNHIIIDRWSFMVMSRWFGYTYEEAQLAWEEQSQGRSAIVVTGYEFKQLLTDKSVLFTQKHPVSDEQKQEWVDEIFGSSREGLW